MTATDHRYYIALDADHDLSQSSEISDWTVIRRDDRDRIVEAYEHLYQRVARRVYGDQVDVLADGDGAALDQHTKRNYQYDPAEDAYYDNTTEAIDIWQHLHDCIGIDARDPAAITLWASARLENGEDVEWEPVTIPTRRDEEM